MRYGSEVFVCPTTRTTLESWYSNAADVLYPVFDGIPVLVPEPEQYLRRHGPWDPRNGVAGQQQEIRGVWSPDAITPFLKPSELEDMGFSIAAYPLDLLNASIIGMQEALKGIRKTGSAPPHLSLEFEDLQRKVGFPEYYDEEARYRTRT